jgi:hypothetical protein
LICTFPFDFFSARPGERELERRIMIKIILNVGLAVALIAMSVSCAHIENSDVEFGIYLVENGELVLSDKYIK